jgi:hypothetical protein
LTPSVAWYPTSPATYHPLNALWAEAPDAAQSASVATPANNRIFMM